ncbi:MAG: type II toxin-antitoxin system VapB family antitoxin [Gammaproteobacteria bacterium]|nr:type II toxin-antitoxin system VapB family antitoxin [Gammaproteobacteria bacterium]
MRTTINIDDELLLEAQKITHIKEKTAVVHAGLKALIEREAARRLAELGGSDPTATAGPRRRSAPPPE